jgi:hypothetical protein
MIIITGMVTFVRKIPEKTYDGRVARAYQEVQILSDIPGQAAEIHLIKDKVGRQWKERVDLSLPIRLSFYVNEKGKGFDSLVHDDTCGPPSYVGESVGLKAVGKDKAVGQF